MSNENLEKRINAKKITYKKPFMGTEGISRYYISLPEKPTKKDYSTMLEMYHKIKNIFASDPNFSRDSPEYAFHEFTDKNRRELEGYKWAISEGFRLLVDNSLVNPETETVFMTFNASSDYPAGTLAQSTAYILAQVNGSNIFPENDHFKENGRDVNPNRKTSLGIHLEQGLPQITNMIFTLLVDTSAHEISGKIEETIKSYVPLEMEVQESLYK